MTSRDGAWRSKRNSKSSTAARSVDDLEISSMLFFDITSAKTDQTPNGKLTPSMTGTPQQILDNLKRYQEAGLTLPLLWPPFRGVPTAKTLVDLRRLKEDILPKL